MKQIFLVLCFALLLSFSFSTVCFAAASYRLTAKDGYLAVWDCRIQDWTEITDTPIASLPTADRTRLESGISCSEQELQILLEDYDS